MHPSYRYFLPLAQDVRHATLGESSSQKHWPVKTEGRGETGEGKGEKEEGERGEGRGERGRGEGEKGGGCGIPEATSLPRANEDRPAPGLPWAPLLLLRLRLRLQYWALARCQHAMSAQRWAPPPRLSGGGRGSGRGRGYGSGDWGWAVCPCVLLKTLRAESAEQGLSWQRGISLGPPRGAGECALGAPRVHPWAHQRGC